MLGKAMGVVIPVALALLAATQWTDIRRYVEIKQLSAGRGGRPDLVPVRGRVGYPQGPGHSQPDGTGDFDARRRGGSGAD